MPDLFVYNGTNKFLDATPTVDDLANGRSVVIPPGSQAMIPVPDQTTYDSIVSKLGSYGSVPHQSVANQTTYAGVSHGTTQASVPAPIVNMPAPKSQQPTKGK